MAILDFEELKKSICVCSFRKEISGSQSLFFFCFFFFVRFFFNYLQLEILFHSVNYKNLHSTTCFTWPSTYWKSTLPTTSLAHSKVELGKVPNGFVIQNIFNLLLFFLVQMLFISYWNFFLYFLTLMISVRNLISLIQISWNCKYMY